MKSKPSPHMRLSKIAPPIYIGLLPSSPMGPLWVAQSSLGLVAVDWSKPQADFIRQVQQRFTTQVICDEDSTAVPLRQLGEYLSGQRRVFDLALDLSGMSAFQMQVLRITSAIPFGRTSTYKEIAARLGNPLAARAVGRVEATNPIPLVIPCHRVLGSDGSLHGYGGPGGIEMKAWLLQMEQSSG